MKSHHPNIHYVSSRKQYIAAFDNEVMPTPSLRPQKGGLSWPGAMNMMRVRYKPVDQLKQLVEALQLKNIVDDEDYQNLLRAREIEKVISRFRKSKSIIDTKAEEKIIKLKHALEKNPIPLTDDEDQAIKDSENKIRTSIKKFVAELNNLKVFAKEHFKDIEKYCDEGNLEAVSQRFPDFVASLAYGIKPSDWKPTTDFDQFCNELKANKMLLVKGAFDPFHQKDEPIARGTITNRELYYWIKPALNNNAEPNQNIVVIGAERKRIDRQFKSHEELVYYINPRYPKNIYQIPYQHFLNAIKPSTFSFKDDKDTLRCYARYIKPGYLQQQKQSYQRVLGKVLLSIYNTRLWNSKVKYASRYSIWNEKNKSFIPISNGIQKMIHEFTSCTRDNLKDKIKNVKKIVMGRLQAYSPFRHEDTHLFYQMMTQLDENNIPEELSKMLLEKSAALSHLTHHPL